MRLKRIVLYNYLSYSHAEIDFSNIRKALIVGMNEGNSRNGNNSGKSNLFQAIGWAVWGDSKAPTLDENVRLGTDECSVEIWFEHDGKEAYIKRTRNSSNGTTSVVFNLDGEDSKSGKSSTKTDQKILDFIRLDYLTYVNSVYIRQEDVYSLANPQKPNQGREILEQILKLEEYDEYEKTTKVKIKTVEKDISESEFFINANPNVDSKIKETTVLIREHESQLKVLESEIDKISKSSTELENRYNSEKDSLNKHKSLNEQIVRSNSMIAAKNAEIQKDKEKDKIEKDNREKRKEELNKKIDGQQKIEEERKAFLEEVGISDEFKKESSDLTESLVPAKQTLDDLSGQLRTKENERILLNKDINNIHAELENLKNKAKNIKVAVGEKCESCFADVTTHSIEALKKHYKDDYVKKVEELEPITVKFEQLQVEESELSSKISKQKLIISGIEERISELRGKIITQKQYEDKLMLFSNRLAEISRYQRELEDLPETKIINMLLAKINQAIEEIENEQKHMGELQSQLDFIKIDADGLSELEEKVRENKALLDGKIRNKYSLEANIKSSNENIKNLESILEKFENNQKLIEENKKKLVVLEQLEKSFGSKGVRAKIVEEAIRELEQEANIMLKRLTNNKLTVVFVTERDGKVVFEVKITDGLKTLSYALYSGSQHFRIGFSLRLALAKMLMRRANSKLDFLLIDEADASLDEQNAEELVNIVNELQDEFYTILCISHRNDIKSHFDDIITVNNDGQSSTIV